MVQKIKLLLLTTFSLVALSPTAALAATPAATPLDCNITPPKTTQEAIQCGTDNAAGAPANATPTSINTTIGNVVNLISVAVGIAAVIMMIIGGFRYITSGGNQESIKSAKNTLLYAIIGLVIVALAQTIVAFTLNKATQTDTATPPTNSTSTPPGGHM